MKNLQAVLLSVGLGLAVVPVYAQTFTGKTVSGFANIMGAGQVDPTPAPAGFGGGVPAAVFDLAPGTGRILTFNSVTGTIQFTPPADNILPDGVLTTGGISYGGSHTGTYISSYGGISGINMKGGVGFLAGVFLTGAPPVVATTPPVLSFTAETASAGEIRTDFGSLAPQIAQTFFVGDGLTGNGTGVRQVFHVPDGATRLFLGMADGYDYRGAPGAYYDNGGAFLASFTVTAVPEPETWATMIAGLGALGAMVRRRKVAA